MPIDESALLKQLDQARAEIAELRLRLSNTSLLLKIEMTASGKLPKFEQEMRRRPIAKEDAIGN